MDRVVDEIGNDVVDVLVVLDDNETAANDSGSTFIERPPLQKLLQTIPKHFRFLVITATPYNE